jgi:hypothetical protein
MATRSAAQSAGTTRPRPLFTVLVGDSTLTSMCQTITGAALDPRHLHPYLGDAIIESILFDGPSRLISMSNQRTFTGALRRGIQARDRRCQHTAGCDTPASRCDIDHIEPASRGGPTSQWNGRLECVPHNRHHHLHDHHTPAMCRPHRARPDSSTHPLALPARNRRGASRRGLSAARASRTCHWRSSGSPRRETTPWLGSCTWPAGCRETPQARPR